jgi:hypothetical protein
LTKSLDMVPSASFSRRHQFSVSPSGGLRAKGLVAKLPNSRRYQLLSQGYSICLVFLKLFERVYAPLTAGLLSPIKPDARLESQRRSQLDRLYQRVIDDLDTLIRAVGLKAA